MQGRGRFGKGLTALETRTDRVLAGKLAGLLFLTGALSVAAMIVLPGPGFTHHGAAWAAVAAAALWGLASLTLIPWDRGHPAWSHLSTVGGLVLVATVAATHGGAASMAHHFLIFIVVYVALFFPVSEAVLYIVVCALVQGFPLAYDPNAIDEGIVHELVAVVPIYAVIGLTILTGRGMLRRITEKHRRLAEEQASLRKIATMVAAGSRPTALFALVASEIRRLLASDAAGVVKFDQSEAATVLASTAAGGPPHEAGTRLQFADKAELSHVHQTGQPCRIDQVASPDRPYGSRICVPFFVEGQLWGGLWLGGRDPGGLSDDAEEQLVDFAELLAVAIGNAEDRDRLIHEAGRDLLTGVGNHHSFAARLKEETGRARRQEGKLTLAVVDVDHFRQLNESVGHDVADRVLVDLARLLEEVTRAEDSIARVTGDEFAVIMPGVHKRDAVVVTERLRQLVAAKAFPGATRLTISAGICDLETANDADSLVRFANGALYWAKSQGRDSSWIYDPEVVRSLSAQERAEYLERSQGLVGLRALARAIDAKDGTTREHSDRVAALAEMLAGALGWSQQRTSRLREAALVHDVGKIGIPDAILLKPSRLTEMEYELVKEHATLSAQIVEGVLSDEQVGWVAAHHERPDGQGYPRGLAGAEISEGAAIIALADSWDVMTAPRLYSEPKDPSDALAECRELIGLQFTEPCVRALERLYESGELAAGSWHRLAGVGV